VSLKAGAEAADDSAEGRVVKWLVRIVVLGALLGVGRELHLRQLRLTEIAGEVEVARDAIDRSERGIERLDLDVGAAADQLALLDRRIRTMEQRSPRGIPRSEYEVYRRLVTERNEVAARYNTLLAEQRRAIDAYAVDVATHNAHVADATAVARRGTPSAVVADFWHRLVGSE